MHHNISSKRKNDGVLTVRQNNSTKALEIEGLNKAAEKITGYSSEDLINKDFRKILPSRIVEYIDSIVDYEDGSSSDLSIAFSRIRQFYILNQEGKEVPVSMKIFHSVATEANNPEFELLMRDLTLITKLEELRSQIVDSNTENDFYRFSEDIKVPSGVVLGKKLDLIRNFINGYPLEITLAICAVDQYSMIQSKYGDDETNFVIGNLSKVISKTMRSGDVLCYLGKGIFGAVLLDCNTTDMQSVINRISNMVKSKPMDLKFSSSSIPVTLSASYEEVTGISDIEKTIEECIKALANLEVRGGNRSVHINQ